MHNIRLPFASLDFQTMIPHTTSHASEDRNRTFPACTESPHRYYNPAHFNQVYAGMRIDHSYGNFMSDSHEESSQQPSHQRWNSQESETFETYFPCDTTLIHPPYYSHDRSHIFEKPQDTTLWTWGQPSCYNDSPSFVETEMPLSPSLVSPANSVTYFHEEATPSPLQLNEFSNVFDSDFSTFMSNNCQISESQSSSMTSSISARRSSSYTMSRSPQDTHSPNLRNSRDVSPTSSEGDHKRRFPCLILGCPRRFTSQYTLKVHMEAHKPKPRVSFPCTLGCSERFSRQHDRLRHEVAKHGKVCEFLCDDCGRFFSSSKTLGNHKCPVAPGGTRWINNN